MTRKNKQAKKRRLARARVHQQKTRHGSVAATERPEGAAPVVDFVEKELGIATTPLQQRLLGEFAPLAQEVIESESERVAPSNHTTGSRAVDANAEQPERAKCPHCGKRQKVRKDGTFGKHNVSFLSVCIGTDGRWDAT